MNRFLKLLMIFGIIFNSSSSFAEGFSDDYSSFLNTNKTTYPYLNKTRKHWSAFGGLSRPDEKLKRIPTLFIHGNSDSALGHDLKDKRYTFTGWSQYLKEFKKKGVFERELYGVSYGFVNPKMAKSQNMDYESIKRVREMIDAILEYTGSDKINIVGHSLGVSIALLSIQGGDVGAALNRPIGENISEKIENFIGIAGAVKGLSFCSFFTFIPTCSKLTGLHPYSLLVNKLKSMSYSGKKVIAIYSKDTDEIIGRDNTGPHPTSELPGQTDAIIYSSKKGDKIGHMGLKDQSIQTVFKLLYVDK